MVIANTEMVVIPWNLENETSNLFVGFRGSTATNIDFILSNPDVNIALHSILRMTMNTIVTLNENLS